MDHLVDFSQGDVIKVHCSQIEDFKRIAQKNNNKKRYRLCLQDNSKNLLQDMMICRTRGDYIRPDKHVGIPESHTIIDGEERIILFSNDGEILDTFILSRNGEYLSYRINSDIYHMTIPLTDTAIDYEVKLGPFLPTSNIYPEWAPSGANRDDVKSFMRILENKINDFVKKI
ncbi:WbuC family cupin fold metalloprotein [Selenomonas ruminantium]|uniref:WbuC family cupin fold metalloprotein n=1 Tax=Selenomonas ruminantium TaxID=971 RepID=UPI0006883446|nr:WbuC family cupin fold metalloprotein [Selenomonas ruminantium]